MNNKKIKDCLNSKMPSIIHFIWLGSELPQNYLKTIIQVSLVAKKSNFTLNLWVDNNWNFEKALEKFYLCGHHIDLNVDSKKIGINVLNINVLLEKLQNDPYYKKNKLYIDFCGFVSREMIGFKNLAAASDFLRYEILRQQGGIYFDTDTKFFIKENSRFEPIMLPLGLKINLDSSGEMYNDIIATVPNHPVFKLIIKKSIKSYNFFNLTPSLNPLLTNLPNDIRIMGEKRFPLKNDSSFKSYSRINLTLQATGPIILKSTLKKCLKNITFSNSDICVTKVGNVEFNSGFDNTWFQNKKITSFDENSLPNTTFFSPLNLEKNKLLETKTQVPIKLNESIIPCILNGQFTRPRLLDVSQTICLLCGIKGGFSRF